MALPDRTINTTKAAHPPIFVYINGYPGVGKFSVAKELAKLLDNAKVLDNHRLIDTTAMLYERGMPEYQPSRKQLRSVVLDSVASSISTKDVTWIFTDQQSSSANGTAAAKTYEAAAKARRSPFVSIVLHCGLEENIKRLSSGGRGGDNTKLTDVGILEAIRENEDIYHFRNDLELEINVTSLEATAVADTIKEFVDTHVENGTLTWTKHTKSSELTFDEIAGFKHVFIDDVLNYDDGSHVELLCWLQSKPRAHSKVVFCDLIDSTGSIQAIFSKQDLEGAAAITNLTAESSLKVWGDVNASRSSGREIIVTDFKVISRVTRHIYPPVRAMNKEVLESKLTDQMLNMRHVYLRNPIILALGEFRSHAFWEIRKWFETYRFVDFSAPLITPTLLYDPKCAIGLSNARKERPLYMSQCAGFYLEAGAHAHERVYNLGPSFRNESRTNRHLMEYWHIKAELCSGNMDDIIDMVEIFLRDISRATRKKCEAVTKLIGSTPPEINVPFTRITYTDAIKKLRDNGHDLSFGDNIGKHQEKWLTDDNNHQPLWITHKAKSLEPFPYCLDPENPTLSLTADLISSNGFGEICGVAEKSWEISAIDERLAEKGKARQQDIYGWVRELREFGTVPHTAFGMGFERLLRWFCGNRHVKDNIPFPRIFDREPMP